jgi:hypothetical protein
MWNKELFLKAKVACMYAILLQRMLDGAVISFTYWSLSSYVKRPSYPLNRRLGGHQNIIGAENILVHATYRILDCL